MVCQKPVPSLGFCSRKNRLSAESENKSPDVMERRTIAKKFDCGSGIRVNGGERRVVFCLKVTF